MPRIHEQLTIGDDLFPPDEEGSDHLLTVMVEQQDDRLTQHNRARMEMPTLCLMGFSQAGRPNAMGWFIDSPHDIDTNYLV